VPRDFKRKEERQKREMGNEGDSEPRLSGNIRSAFRPLFTATKSAIKCMHLVPFAHVS
jgi:hypothetical protein